MAWNWRINYFAVTESSVVKLKSYFAIQQILRSDKAQLTEPKNSHKPIICTDSVCSHSPRLWCILALLLLGHKTHDCSRKKIWLSSKSLLIWPCWFGNWAPPVGPVRCTANVQLLYLSHLIWSAVKHLCIYMHLQLDYSESQECQLWIFRSMHLPINCALRSRTFPKSAYPFFSSSSLRAIILQPLFLLYREEWESRMCVDDLLTWKKGAEREWSCCKALTRMSLARPSVDGFVLRSSRGLTVASYARLLHVSA